MLWEYEGPSNSVASFLESVADCIENKFECISSEDMLNSSKMSNKIMDQHRKEWKQKRLNKLNCTKCNYKDESLTHCHLCIDEMEPNQNEQETKEMHYDCDICGQEWRNRMEQDCEECGPGIFWEEQEVCLLGLDVVALFPSMTAITTGKIIREHVRKSLMKIEGFDWRQAGRYIVINRKYTGGLDCLRDVLPWKRNKGNIAPGMKSKELNSKKGEVTEKWNFPKREPTDTQIREMQARVADIGTRFLFENFVYKFSKDNYHQQEGGPIGARVTMAAARIVMSDWGEKMKSILETAGILIGMLKGYVDDVRNKSTCLKYGTRWDDNDKEFKITEDAKKEDMRLRVEQKETSNQRMMRVCLPAINSINKDLVFTGEVPEDFEDSKLPTLDFFFWLTREGLLNHSYYQKAIKTPLVIMERSAMGNSQRFQILSNEMVRRLSNTNHEEPNTQEVLDIIETYTQQLKSSGYERGSAREAVVSGVLGWLRKIERRKKEKTPFYRSAKSTLKQRCKKKILEKTTWYKNKRKREDDGDPHESKRHCDGGGKSRKGLQEGERRKVEKAGAELEKDDSADQTKCISNNDCPRNKACQQLKCIDPCPGICGQNARCSVLSHIPTCTCNRGFIGDPFTACREIPKCE